MNRPIPDLSREGERAFVRAVSVPLLGMVRGGFRPNPQFVAGGDLRQRRNFSLNNGPDLLIVRSVGREEKCGGPREALWKTGLKTN